MARAEDFQLHERLAADTVSLGCSRLCEVRLMNDSSWPWIILVPRVAGIREIYELSGDQQARLVEESSILSRGMMALFSGDKMNVAALGNMVPQLHLHHIVRFQADPAWPGPVWGVQPPVPYEGGQLSRMVERLNPLLQQLK
ncbi:MAG: HIT family protein [Gammaproteobacteria bacterium]|nr:MAG: HIT family protein [Gammaproteobacteria bacterium]